MKKILFTLALLTAHTFMLQASNNFRPLSTRITVINETQDGLQAFFEEEYIPSPYRNDEATISPGNSMETFFLTYTEKRPSNLTFSMEIKNKSTQEVLFRCDEENNTPTYNLLLNKDIVAIIFKFNQNKQVEIVSTTP